MQTPRIAIGNLTSNPIIKWCARRNWKENLVLRLFVDAYICTLLLTPLPPVSLLVLYHTLYHTFGCIFAHSLYPSFQFLFSYCITLCIRLCIKILTVDAQSLSKYFHQFFFLQFDWNIKSKNLKKFKTLILVDAYLHTLPYPFHQFFFLYHTLFWRQPRFIALQTRFHSIYSFYFGIFLEKAL